MRRAAAQQLLLRRPGNGASDTAALPRNLRRWPGHGHSRSFPHPDRRLDPVARRIVPLPFRPPPLIDLVGMNACRLRPPASLYVAGPFSMGYVDFFTFLIPLYALSLGLDASEIGILVGARSILALFLSIHIGVGWTALGHAVSPCSLC